MVNNTFECTHVGLLPRDWECVQVNEVIDEISMGPFGSDITVSNFVSSGIPVLNGYNVSRIQLIDKFQNFVTPKKAKELKKAVAHRRDIIVTHRGTIGQVSYIPDDSAYPVYVISQSQFRVHFNDKKVNPYFLVSYFLSPIGQGYLLETKGHTGVPALAQPTTNFRQLWIPLPEIAEQTAIAEALSNMDSLISSLQRLIEKKKAIKQGAMQELLTGKKRLPGSNGEWVQKYLKEIVNLRKERADPIEIDNQRCIELEHIESNSGRILGWCESKAQKSLKAIFYPNDILWGKLRPYLRKYAQPEFGGVCSTEFWVLNTETKCCCNDFIYYLLQTEAFVSAANSTTGTKMPRADWNLVQELEVKIPADKHEQQAIAQVLSDMDDEIEQLERKLTKYQQIKQGMIQELLSGRIRLGAEESHVQPKAQAVQEKKPRPAHNQHFDDAVMIAGIVNAFYSAKYPLGRKKVQKLLYLVRRKEQADTSAFHKKAAGPYADEVRYKGGEPIARKNQYIQVEKSNRGSRFGKGAQMQQALDYLRDWGKQADIDWLVSQFQYTKVDELELLATVDMAICDLRSDGKEVSVSAIKDLIGSNKEWRDKLKKDYFKDTDIQRAIERCKKLFSDKEG